jgi:peptidoglycan/LPS O-acetylase OafA/YrhL
MSTTTNSLPQGVATANSVYYPALDGIRAMALAMVFMDHYGGVGILGVGVNVFFVLSGFLITGILLDTREQPHRLRNFYVRRTLRIFPLYYGVFLLLLLVTPCAHWSWNNAWLLWPAYLGNYLLFLPQWLPRHDWFIVANAQLFTPGGVVLQLGHFWTLCVEEQFYLLWPWFVFTRSRRFLLWFCGVAIVVLPLLRTLAAHTFPPAAIRAGVLFRTLPFQADSLLLGAMLAMLLRGEYRSQLVRYGRLCGSVLAVAAVAFVYCRIDLHLPALHQPFLKTYPPLSWQLSVVNLVSGALILASLQPGSWVYRVFHLRPLRWLGRISYGAYVFHNIPHGYYGLMASAVWPAHDQLMTAMFAIVCTVLLAALSYRFFEMPFLRLKERWTVRG